MGCLLPSVSCVLNAYICSAINGDALCGNLCGAEEEGAPRQEARVAEVLRAPPGARRPCRQQHRRGSGKHGEPKKGHEAPFQSQYCTRVVLSICPGCSSQYVAMQRGAIFELC